MDGELFDAMLRGEVNGASRRGLLHLGIRAVAAAALGGFGPGTRHDAWSKGKKRNRCRHLRRAGWYTCGDGCCRRASQVCCDDPSDLSGKSCKTIGTEC
jgi:hypothetical protein